MDCGICGLVLQWLNWNLLSHKNSTIIDAMSVLAEVLFEVPQGSVLGPPLFVMYVLPMSDIVQHTTACCF